MCGAVLSRTFAQLVAIIGAAVARARGKGENDSMRLRGEPWAPVCASTEVSKRDDIAWHATEDRRREIVSPLRVMNMPG